MNVFHRGWVIAVLSLLAACASSGADLPSLGGGAADGDAALGAYRLGPGDKVAVTVFGAPDLGGEMTIGDAGSVNAPLVGQIKAVGFTTAAFADAWRDKLREGFMRDPKVSVQVVAYRPVYIFGEVTKPGGYPFAPGMTVRSAVALGGGFSYRAQDAFVVVTRSGNDYRAPPTAPLLPDDIVRVPERTM